MKKGKFFTKAMIPSFLVMLVGIISLTTSTYTWFTTSNTATVDEITVNVQAAGGLQIALANPTSFTWKSSLANPVTGDDAKLKPASTDGKFTVVTGSPSLNFFSAKVENFNSDSSKYYINGISGVDVNNGYKQYAKFAVALHNTGAVDVKINLEGSEIFGGVSANAARVALVPSTSKAYTTGLNSTSFSEWTTNANSGTEPGFIILNNHADADEDEEEGDTFGITKAQIDGDDALYDEYTGDRYYVVNRKTSGVTAGNMASTEDTYFVWDTEDSAFEAFKLENDYVEIASSTDAASYLNKPADEYSKNMIYTADTGKTVFTPVTYGTAVADGTTYYYQKEATVYQVEKYASLESDYKLFSKYSSIAISEVGNWVTIPAGQVMMVTAFVWVEGQDIHCLNNIASFAFNINLKFNAVEQNS